MLRFIIVLVVGMIINNNITYPLLGVTTFLEKLIPAILVYVLLFKVYDHIYMYLLKKGKIR